MKSKNMVDTLGFLSISQAICVIEGYEDDAESHLDRSAVFSYILSRNGFLHRMLEIPEELVPKCEGVWNSFLTYQDKMGDPWSGISHPFFGKVNARTTDSPTAA